MKEQVFFAKKEASILFKKGQRLIIFLGVGEAQKVPGAVEAHEVFWELQRSRWCLIVVETQMVSFIHGGPHGFKEPWRPKRFLRDVEILNPRSSGNSEGFRASLRSRSFLGAAEIQKVSHTGRDSL